MTAINKELYDALLEAGASEGKATAAATTIPADLATRADIAALRADTDALRLATKAEIAELRAEVRGWLLAQTGLLIAALAVAVGVIKLT